MRGRECHWLRPARGIDDFGDQMAWSKPPIALEQRFSVPATSKALAARCDLIYDLHIANLAPWIG
jgi:hypothetical protein